MELKDTLLMPKSNFPMRGNLGVREKEFQAKWEEMDLYNKVLEKNKDNTPFILHDGPPYANGNIHIGHALQKTLKDFVLRYKTMKGFYVPFIPGWDTHGLPIENEVVKKGIKREEHSIVDFRLKCEMFALEQVEKQKSQFKRLGILGDWDNPYLTLDKKYIADQLLVFGKMAEKNLIYRGLKPVYWSPSSESAFAEAEIEYQDKESLSIFFKFPLVNQNNELKDANLLIWTTTPWTLPANLAVSVHPDFNYVLVDTKFGKLVLLEDLLESLNQKLNLEALNVIKRFKGNELENIEYKHPLYDRISKVILGKHVTNTDGTGLVHTAPGHGEDDYEVGLLYKLDILSPVDGKGVMTSEAGKYEGLFYEVANKEIVNDLEELGYLVKQEKIVHSYPHDWRTRKPIIFRSTPQWFASIDPLRENLLEEIKNINWTPAWGEVRLSNMIESRNDWVISRQRVWGVPLPIFYAENGEAVLDYEIIKHISSLVREHGINIWYDYDVKDLMPKGYKNVNSPNGIFTKEKDIMDVWFDSGTSYKVLEERGLPTQADLYLEGSDQYRGWFNSSLTTSVAVTGKSPYKNVVSHGFVLDGQGYKMSKSKGNVIDPIKMMDQQGADLLRLWVATTSYQSDVRISDELIKQTSESYRKIRNTFKYMLGNLFDFDPSKNYISYSMRGKLNRLMTLKYREVVNKVIDAYDNYEFDKVYRIIMPFIINDVSAFYLDFIKDVLYIELENNFERRAIQSTLYDILLGLLKLLNPIIPHTTSEAYWELPHRQYEDIYLESMPEKNDFTDQKLVDSFAIFEELREEVLKELETARILKVIGKSLESLIELKLTKEQIEAIKYLDLDLELVLISSKVIVTEGNMLEIKVSKYGGHVCERCWRTFKKLNSNNLCERCNNVVEELNK
ncbi:isoleucine--tRNA ligase [Haploplasma modicum]|uniref:isoleucine--tRNA ligase n=1 Tax=Haploplasma modicum TaxID=2150 RepID=UPI00138B0A59|nr:isoleucine--tRNA ligase [Haploplasma modicum]